MKNIKIFLTILILMGLVASYLFFETTLEEPKIKLFDIGVHPNSIEIKLRIDVPENAIAKDNSYIQLLENDIEIERKELKENNSEIAFDNLEVGQQYQVRIVYNYNNRFYLRNRTVKKQKEVSTRYAYHKSTAFSEGKMFLEEINNYFLFVQSYWRNRNESSLSILYDESHNEVWRKTFDGDYVSGVVFTSDNKIVLASRNRDMNQRIVNNIRYLNTYGQSENTISLNKIFNTTAYNRFFSGARIVEAEDGGIISSVVLDGDVHILKLDKDLNVLWKKRIVDQQPINNGLHGISNILHKNEDYYVVASQEVIDSFKTYNPKLVLFNESGSILWSKSFGADSWDEITDVQIQDEYIYAVGKTRIESTLFDSFIIKLDLDGNLMWRKDFDEAPYENLENIEINNDGELVIVGFEGDNTVFEYRGIILHIDNDGEIKYKQNLSTGYGHNIMFRENDIIMTMTEKYVGYLKVY